VKIAVVTLSCAVAVAALAGVARGEPRFDFFGGVSIGAGIGSGGVEDSDDVSPTLAIRGGGFATPSLALYLEGWQRKSSMLPPVDVCVDNQALGAGARAWPGWGWTWGAAAVGVSRRSVGGQGDCFDTEFKRNAGVWSSATAGVDIVRARQFSIDVSARLNLEYYPEAFESFADDEATSSVFVATYALELGVAF
jgi:hypothetical protein